MEMVHWRSISQEFIDGLWKELCGTMYEGVLERYKVDEAKKGAYRRSRMDYRGFI